MMDLREKIYHEIRERKIESQGRWVFQEYNLFYNDLNSTEKKEFTYLMQLLCDEEIFEIERDESVFRYRLTEKGENIIYRTGCF